MSRPVVAPCGTRASRARGCDCDACRNASRDYHRDWRAGRAIARGTDTVEGLLAVEPVGDWIGQAACAGLPGDWFFPENKGRAGTDEIRAICGSCPVQADCLRWAVRNQINEGWFGGEPPRNRRRLRLAGLEP